MSAPAGSSPTGAIPPLPPVDPAGGAGGPPRLAAHAASGWLAAAGLGVLERLGPDLLTHVAALLPARERVKLALTVSGRLRGMLLSGPAVSAGLWRQWDLACGPPARACLPAAALLRALTAVPWAQGAPGADLACRLDLSGNAALSAASLAAAVAALSPPQGTALVVAAAPAGPRLIALDLSGCHAASDALLAVVAARAGPHLRELSLCGLAHARISREGVLSLLAACPGLTVLRLRQPGGNTLSFSGFTRADLEEMARACPRLTSLEAELTAGALLCIGELWPDLRYLTLCGLPRDGPSAAAAGSPASEDEPGAPRRAAPPMAPLPQLRRLTVRRHWYYLGAAATHTWLPRVLRAAAERLTSCELELPIYQDVDSHEVAGEMPRNRAIAAGAPAPVAAASRLLQARARLLRRRRSMYPDEEGWVLRPPVLTGAAVGTRPPRPAVAAGGFARLLRGVATPALRRLCVSGASFDARSFRGFSAPRLDHAQLSVCDGLQRALPGLAAASPRLQQLALVGCSVGDVQVYGPRQARFLAGPAKPGVGGGSLRCTLAAAAVACRRLRRLAPPGARLMFRPLRAASAADAVEVD